MGFESITNAITSQVNSVMSANSYTARYSNDARDTPTDDYWCHVSLAYGNSDQVELNPALYRTAGVLTIIVVGPMKKGTGLLLEMADKLATAFRSLSLGSGIRFRTPRIENVGRVNDSWQINVICPFIADEN